MRVWWGPMTVSLKSRADINLAAVYRVAWKKEAVEISQEALNRIAACREAFLQLIDTDPNVTIYGVTTAMGELASRRLEAEERSQHARIKAFAAATSFGEPFPERVVRAMILARLTNFIEGNAATTPRIALAVAKMLNEQHVPCVSMDGQGGAGEILALYPLFAHLSEQYDLEVKERGSLINGSPCAAALVADAALAARRRISLAEKAFALSIEAFRAPLEHYDEALEGLWGDAHDALALQGLRQYLRRDAAGRRNYQAPVSFRIVPRILGQAHRALAAAEHAAAISLSAISDNPVFIPPDEDSPLGRCISTGGYHNAMAAPALDDLAAIWADLCLLADRHSSKLLTGKVSHLPDLLMVGRDPADSDGHGNVGYVPMAITGYLEEAKTWAQRTFIPGTESAGAGQDDVAATAFAAWKKEMRAGRCFDAALAGLLVIASQAFYVTDRDPPEPLAGFVRRVREIVPPVDADRVLGPELRTLAAYVTSQVFEEGEESISLR